MIMRRLRILLLLAIPFISKAQEQRARKEFTMPLHPWTLIGASYYVQYEHYTSAKRSYTLSAGYKGSDFLTFYFNKGEYSGQRLALGRRFYSKPQERWLNLFTEGKLMIEHGKLNLPALYGTTDSLRASGFTFTPELLGGFKTTILQRVVVTLNVGLRYRINTLNTDKLTYNPKYWEYDDWDNQSLDPEVNRAYITNFNKDFRPSVNLNFGFLFR